MFRKLTLTSVLAFALVAAPFTAPAALARDDGDRLLIGLAALGVLGAIVHDSNKSSSSHTYRRPVYVQPRPQPRVHYVRPPQHATVPPRQCLRQKWTRSGWVRFYNQACVNQYRPIARGGYYHR